MYSMYRCLVDENYYCNFELGTPFNVRRRKRLAYCGEDQDNLSTKVFGALFLDMQKHGQLVKCILLF